MRQKKPKRKKGHVRAKKAKTSHSKIRARPNRSKKKIQKRKPKFSANTKRRSTKPKRSSSGFGSRVRVDSHRHGPITIDRKTTTLRTGIRFTREENSKIAAKNFLQTAGARHFKSVGKSHKNLYLVKIKYSYKFMGKTKEGFFSISVAEIKTGDQLNEVIDEAVSRFQGKLREYQAKNFTRITVTGIVFQGYKK